MPREIKFTPFGVPYIHEFGNVTFTPQRPRHRDPHSQPVSQPSAPQNTLYSPSPSSSTSSFCYIESPQIPPRSPAFSFPLFFKRKSTRHFSLQVDPSPSHRQIPPNDSTNASSNDTKPLPLPHSDVSDAHGIYIRFPLEHSHTRMNRKERLVCLQKAISVAVLDAGMSSSPGNNAHPEKHSDDKPSHGTRGYRTTDALFCGTFGQLMSALEGAGLSATPCSQDPGLSGYTRLGALFVARGDGASGVQLRKIALWG